MTDRQRILDATDARAKAQELLSVLLDAKATTESQGGGPRGDLYKRVTGQSSLENAIAATRRTIEAYDRLIAQMERDVSGGDAELTVQFAAARVKP
jgi:hypothetical protein